MRYLRVLVLCEESQQVTKQFRYLGHEAYSCDLKDCSGGNPQWHLKMDAFEALKYMKWDIIILHPPCTFISVSGNRYYGKGKPMFYKRVEAVDWTQKLWDECCKVCDYVMMENPVGVLNSMGNFPKPQYIQPWQFGHGETKKTGLWMKGLPNLVPTNIVEGREQKVWKMAPTKDPEVRKALRSKTYQGIAEAIAVQFSEYLLCN